MTQFSMIINRLSQIFPLFDDLRIKNPTIGEQPVKNNVFFLKKRDKKSLDLQSYTHFCKAFIYVNHN